VLRRILYSSLIDTIHNGKNAANYGKSFAAFSGKINSVIYGKLLAVYKRSSTRILINKYWKYGN
ncbi:MAG: hypothetical protein II038_05280, partial [Lachnospiraceae bacterium]|nr:hypothetical protein [Lachnospiraceae bacterium]